MPRVNEKVKSKAGKPYTCNKCSEPIEPGQKYYEWTFYRGAANRRHQLCGRPKQSELTNSKMAGVYSAVEGIENEIGEVRQGKSDLSSLASTIDAAIGDVEQVRDEYQESIDNMGENLAQGQTGQDMQEKIDALEEFISELQDAQGNVESAAAEYDDTKDEDAAEGILDSAVDEVESTLGNLSV